MKNAVIFLAFVLCLASCSKTESGNVRIKFTNTTGHQLIGLNIAGENLGTLGNNEQTNYISYYEFDFDGSWPFEPTEAILNGGKTHDWAELVWCATGMYTVEEGTYDMDIILWVRNNKDYLRLKCK